MKKACIIGVPDFRLVQGINYTSKTLIEGNSFCKEMQIVRAFSGTQTIYIDKGDSMPIGSDIGTFEYNRRRALRTFLRKLLSNNFYPFALFKYYINAVRGRRKAIERFVADDAEINYIIFQDIQAAYEYFKNTESQKKAKRLDVKTIVVIHAEDDEMTQLLSDYPAYGRGDMKRRMFGIRDLVYSKINCVMYISKRAYNNSIMPECKKTYVYNGVPDYEYTEPSHINDVLQFVCLGNIFGWKGQDVIVSAMEKMDKKHLDKMIMHFIGDGCDAEILKQRCKDNGLSDFIRFWGRRNDVAEILRDKDIYILPSIKEGLPMSALESLRAGMFLMMTDTGGCAEIAEDNTGIMITRDAEQLKEDIVAVLDNNTISIQQKNRCRRRYESCFTLEKMCHGYENLLLSL